MKYIATAVLLLASLGQVLAQTRVDWKMQVDSMQRQCIISVPSGAVPPGGYPLVFMFHGTSQDGEKFYADSQWKEKGESEKFLTVFPTGLEYCIDEDGQRRITTKWHTGELEEMACPGQYLKDDRHFVRAMLDSIKATWPVDARRIYASGFSNGAGFASKLAVDMRDVFAAIGISGGILSDRDSTAPKRPIPVWFDLGTRDNKWLKRFIPLGITELPFNDSILYLLAAPLNRMLGAFNLSHSYTKSTAGRLINYLFNTPASAGPSTEFRFTLIDKMFHVYPDGSNVPIKAADVFWNFFSQYTTPVAVESVPESPLTISLYPNPAGSYVAIDGARDATITLRNLLGQEVLRAHVVQGAQLALPCLVPGMYSAEILSGSQRVLKTLAIQ